MNIQTYLTPQISNHKKSDHLQLSQGEHPSQFEPQHNTPSQWPVIL
jgi:hypothetical protein